MGFKDKNIVIIGGGTGNSVLLREFKKYTENLTAIVTVADDGGSTGKLRQEMGILAVGDIRNCISALAEDDTVMTKLMEYRFKSGELEGHCFGNLFLAALNDISDSFPKAIKGISEVLNIKGEVVAVSKNDDICLCATLENTTVVNGESNIPEMTKLMKSRVKKVFLLPRDAKVNDYAVEKIEQADIIIISPGSLFTSIMPNLLIEDIPRAITANKKAKKYYITNIMTQNGETNNFDVGDHVDEIEKHIPRECQIFDEVIYSNSDIPYDIRVRYAKEGAAPVRGEYAGRLTYRYKFTGLDLADVSDNVVRHNSKVLIEYIIKDNK